MAKKRVGELPSGNIRKKVYDHSEPVFDQHGHPVIDPKTGKQKKKKIYISVTASSAAEAKRLAAAARIEKQPRKICDLTLYEAIDDYIAKQDALLSPSTVRGYRNIQKNNFRSIMYKPIKAITTDDLSCAVNMECKRKKKDNHGREIDRKVSSKTVHNAYGLIRTVISKHSDIDLDVTLPQPEKKQNELSTPDVIFNIVKGTDIELAVLLAMWLSFTRSEILGLTKSKSISADGNYITVKEVVVRDEHNESIVKTKAKEPSRNRTLRIPPYIKQLIDNVETDALVSFSGDALYRKWSTLIKKAGIPYMTFHDLRHVSASVMAVLQVPDKYAQDRGGWKTDNIMKSTYMQAFDPYRKQVDDQIDTYMEQMLFHRSSDLFEKKYRSYLVLFDLKDTAANKRAFTKFCNEHSIKT